MDLSISRQMFVHCYSSYPVPNQVIYCAVASSPSTRVLGILEFFTSSLPVDLCSVKIEKTVPRFLATDSSKNLWEILCEIYWDPEILQEILQEILCLPEILCLREILQQITWDILREILLEILQVFFNRFSSKGFIWEILLATIWVIIFSGVWQIRKDKMKLFAIYLLF